MYRRETNKMAKRRFWAHKPTDVEPKFTGFGISINFLADDRVEMPMTFYVANQAARKGSDECWDSGAFNSALRQAHDALLTNTGWKLAQEAAEDWDVDPRTFSEYEIDGIDLWVDGERTGWTDAEGIYSI
jgi:hypothetical protein